MKVNLWKLERWPLFLMVFVGLLGRLLLMPRYLEDYDSIYFTQALTHYSVLTLSPHWPGYPVFIWGAKLVFWFMHDTSLALHMVSAAASSLTVIPLAALAMGFVGLGRLSEVRVRWAGLAAVMLWTVVPISWVDGTEALSDPLAAFCAACLLYASWRAMQGLESRWLLMAGVCAGSLLGIRLAGATLLGVLLWPVGVVLLSKLPPLERFRRVGLVLAGVVVAVAVWFGWQLSVDGLRWFEVGREMLGSHHLDWVVGATEDSLPAQLGRFARTVLANGLGGLAGLFAWDRALVTVGWCLGIAAGCWTMLKPPYRRSFGLLATFVLPHLVWVFLTRDLTSARYALPVIVTLVPLATVGLCMLLLPGNSSFSIHKIPLSVLVASIAAALFIFASLRVTFPLALEHRDSPPVEQQQVKFIQSMVSAVATGRNATLLMQEPMLFTRSMLIGVRMPIRDAATVGPDEPEFEDRTKLVLASSLNMTLKTWPNWWQPIARFCRNPLLRARTRDANQIVLYRYVPRAQRSTEKVAERLGAELTGALSECP
jgi:4-amino-4-deoxy-L-arabinose transferase-like glycosyltransferase